jgi:hypothetical protein
MRAFLSENKTNLRGYFTVARMDPGAKALFSIGILDKSSHLTAIGRISYMVI